ncbi:hypothetical protein DJ71_22480, partial [Halorubrum sp. E3]
MSGCPRTPAVLRVGRYRWAPRTHGRETSDPRPRGDRPGRRWGRDERRGDGRSDRRRRSGNRDGRRRRAAGLRPRRRARGDEPRIHRREGDT